MGKLLKIPIAAIRENPVALRSVNRESDDYVGLVDSIKGKGFFGAITVRAKVDPETNEEYYELVDGLHRFSAVKDAGISEINVDIVDLDDAEVLEAQVMSNIHKIETKPIEYSRQLLRILACNSHMTEAKLATKLGKSTQWIKERLGLTKIINADIAALIDEGKITLSNAYALAKLPPEEMGNFIDSAMTKNPDEFVPMVNARVKEINEAKRQGKDAAPAEFTPIAFMQKIGDLKNEAESGEIGKALIKSAGAKTAQDGFDLAIKWCLHLDPKSVEAQKAKDDERKKLRDEKKKQKDADKAQKKAEKTAKEADEAAKAAAELAGN